MQVTAQKFIEDYIVANFLGGETGGKLTMNADDLVKEVAEVVLEGVAAGLASGAIHPKEDLEMKQAAGVIGVIFANGIVGATSDPKLAAQHGEPTPLYAVA